MSSTYYIRVRNRASKCLTNESVLQETKKQTSNFFGFVKSLRLTNKQQRLLTDRQTNHLCVLCGVNIYLLAIRNKTETEKSVVAIYCCGFAVYIHKFTTGAGSKHLILAIDLYNFCIQCYYYDNLFCISLSVTSYQLALYTSSITLYHQFML